MLHLENGKIVEELGLDRGVKALEQLALIASARFEVACRRMSSAFPLSGKSAVGGPSLWEPVLRDAAASPTSFSSSDRFVDS